MWCFYLQSLHEKPFKTCWWTGTIWGATNIGGASKEKWRSKDNSQRDRVTDEWSETSAEQKDKDQQREIDLYYKKVWLIYKIYVKPFGPIFRDSPEGIIGRNYFSERWTSLKIEGISISEGWSRKIESESSRREIIWGPIQRKSFYLIQIFKRINSKPFKLNFFNLKSKLRAFSRNFEFKKLALS